MLSTADGPIKEDYRYVSYRYALGKDLKETAVVLFCFGKDFLGSRRGHGELQGGTGAKT